MQKYRFCHIKFKKFFFLNIQNCHLNCHHLVVCRIVLHRSSWVQLTAVSRIGGHPSSGPFCRTHCPLSSILRCHPLLLSSLLSLIAVVISVAIYCCCHLRCQPLLLSSPLPFIAVVISIVTHCCCHPLTLSPIAVAKLQLPRDCRVCSFKCLAA